MTYLEAVKEAQRMADQEGEPWAALWSQGDWYVMRWRFAQERNHALIVQPRKVAGIVGGGDMRNAYYAKWPEDCP